MAVNFRCCPASSAGLYAWLPSRNQAHILHASINGMLPSRSPLHVAERPLSLVKPQCLPAVSSSTATPAASDSTVPLPSPQVDSIPAEKLKSLRKMGLEMRDVIKLGRLGVGKGIIHQINMRWHTSEIAKLYCGGKAGVNMKVMVEDLERKTGGIVVHRSGGSVFLYRGENFNGNHGDGRNDNDAEID